MPLRGKPKAHNLAERVDPLVGSAGGVRHYALASQLFEDALELTLHGAVGALSLPTCKVVADVLEDGVEWRHRHGRQSTHELA